VFVKSNKKRDGNKVYETHLLVESKWVNGKSVHDTILNLSKLPIEAIEAIKKSLKKGKVYAKDEIKITKTKEYGLLDVLLILTKSLKLDKLLGENHKEVLAMMFNRLIDPRSKRALQSWAETTALSELLKLNNNNLDNEKLYLIMDELLKDKENIEKKLFESRAAKPKMILYDITSTYFEGNECEIAKYGYSRDHRSDREQIVIGLVTDEEGIPISVEVYEGNTVDKSTLKGQIANLKEKFNIEESIFVFDRGMVTKANLEYIRTSKSDYITAITKPEMDALISNNDEIQLSIFDETDILEYSKEGLRYILCNNPLRAKSDNAKREKRINKTIEKLETLKKSISKGKKEKPEKYIIEKVASILNKHHTKKFLNIKTGVNSLEYSKDEEEINRDKKLDGKYTLKTTIKETPDNLMDKETIRKHYKSLSQVEDAFKDIKNYIDMRPIYHYRERRVKAHVFICFLAYYLLKHMEIRLKPLLENYTLYELTDELKKLQLNTMDLCGETFPQFTEKTELQKQIYSLIKNSKN
jgi:transposase